LVVAQICRARLGGDHLHQRRRVAAEQQLAAGRKDLSTPSERKRRPALLECSTSLRGSQT
jgi:hypothetical protein